MITAHTAPLTLPPAEVKEVLGGPCRKEGTSTCPVATIWTIQTPDPPGKLLSAGVAQNPLSAERKKKHSTWEVLHSSVSKAQRKKKNISCPRHPHWTASFPPPPSLQQTNIVKDKHRCCSPVLITRFFKTRNKGFHMCLSLKESLRAFSSRNINEQIDFFHIQYTVVPTAADQPCKVQVLQSSCSILTAQCLIQPIATHQMLHFRSTHIFW